MRTAVERYAEYRIGEDRAALGRFIVPFSRLRELEAAAKDLLPRGPESEPWRLSVLVVGDPTAVGVGLLKFNDRHRPGSSHGHAVVDVVELKAETVEDIARQRTEIPRFFTLYFEIPARRSLASFVGAIAKVGARAKIRTGGITQDAFPAAGDILAFLRACRDRSVVFKATAGLHHPVRGKFRLTYQPNSPLGVMYGFLNVFLAAAFVHFDLPPESAHGVLEETDGNAFALTDETISWRDVTLDVGQIKAFRAESAASFGSCSFREPIDEVARLSGHSLAPNK